MRRLSFTVSLFVYVWGTHGFDAVRTVRHRSRLAARVTAKRLLTPHVVRTTNDCYHRDVSRGAFAEVTRGALRAETVSAEIRVERSVGELGVTP